MTTREQPIATNQWNQWHEKLNTCADGAPLLHNISKCSESRGLCDIRLIGVNCERLSLRPILNCLPPPLLNCAEDVQKVINWLNVNFSITSAQLYTARAPMVNATRPAPSSCTLRRNNFCTLATCPGRSSGLLSRAARFRAPRCSRSCPGSPRPGRRRPARYGCSLWLTSP